MKSITLACQLSQEIFNGTQRFAEALSRPQQFNFREIIRGMLVSGLTYLNHMLRRWKKHVALLTAAMDTRLAEAIRSMG